MKISKFIIVIACLLGSLLNYSQQRPDSKKVKVTGKVIEKSSNQLLEAATVTLVNSKNPKMLFGGLTNEKGEFSVDVVPGSYSIKVVFFSFKPFEIKQKTIQEATNLGTISLSDDTTQLKEVTVVGQKASVEIKLDKKIYNVSQDLTVKGGTASDVLDNVPSVTVDGDGNVSLRGNDNVKILIDGRPSTAINIADALRSISADALDKVEVITNPSARYDAEGGAGIINIVLKKGKNQGINGTFIANAGNPKNYGVNGNLNYKTENFNLFGTLGYNDSKAPGMSLTDTNYLNTDGSIQKTINERVERTNARKGHNFSFGLDWYLDKSLTWTNAFSYRKNDGSTPMNDVLYNYAPTNSFVRNRFNDQQTKANDVEYTTNFTKKFKKEGHKLTVDGSFSKNLDNDASIITDYVIGQENLATRESTKNYQTQGRNLLQTDYVLPFGKNSQLETGYKGEFNKLLTDYNLFAIDNFGTYTPNPNYTNKLDYRESINALYAQIGTKFNKLSVLMGIRYEDSNIDINLLTTNNLNNRKYHNFFPSAFLTYQLTEQSSFSLNYSKRIARPRNRFINPFSNYTSNVNIFQGNPFINPSLTDAVDFGFMTKFSAITLTTSLYYNYTKAPFQFIRRPNGDSVTSTVDGQTVITPVILSTPVNLDHEERIGFEFNVNYSPFKWWKLNGNFNLFQSKMIGDYSYVLNNTSTTITNNASITAGSWFSRLSSKITLPGKIEWQTNGTYNAPQNNAQGRSLGVLSANIAFSKDVLKDKATISLNVNDLFNSRKRINETNLASLNSYSEMQFRQRQINLSFTYRFNKVKTEREKPAKNENGGGDGGDFPG